VKGFENKEHFEYQWVYKVKVSILIINTTIINKGILKFGFGNTWLFDSKGP
jgi:hypothetical protein